MRGIARLAMRGPTIASVLTATFAAVALAFAPALLVSGGLVALVTLRQGSGEGLRVMIVAGLLVALAALALFGRIGIAAAFIVLTWLPLWLAASGLRRVGDQGQAIAVLGGTVAVYAVLIRATLEDVDGFWRERLQVLASSVKAEGGQFLSVEELSLVANVMHEASLVIVSSALVAMLLLARWWQAALYNPGGFGVEFRKLVLPRWISPVAAAVAVAGLVAAARAAEQGIAGDLMIVLVILFAVQGLAVTHERVAARRLGAGWLMGLYILLLFLPHVVATALAATGIADTLADFRRLRRRPTDAG